MHFGDIIEWTADKSDIYIPFRIVPPPRNENNKKKRKTTKTEEKNTGVNNVVWRPVNANGEDCIWHTNNTAISVDVILLMQKAFKPLVSLYTIVKRC